MEITVMESIEPFRKSRVASQEVIRLFVYLLGTGFEPLEERPRGTRSVSRG